MTGDTKAGQGGGPRRLALLGGTGRTGRLLIDEALLAGHELRVLARAPARLHRTAPRLRPVAGDARNADDLDRLLEGMDAVLSALGPVRGDRAGAAGAGVMTAAAQGLVRRMPAAGVSRLVTLTGAGVDQPGDRPGPVDRVFRVALRLLQPDVLRDSEGHVQIIRASTLDWTVVRVPRLTDGPARPVRSGLVGDIGPLVTRASVAAFMLAQLDRPESVRQAPAVSN